MESRPVGGVALVIGSLSLAGIPPLSGFISKEGILAPGLEIESLPGYLIFFGAILASFLSALYMTRLVLVVAQGEPAQATAGHGAEGGHAAGLHDAPPLMSVPLVLLIVLAAALGIALSFGWDFIEFLTDGHREFHFNSLLALASTLTAVAGIGIGLNYWNNKERVDESMLEAFGGLPKLIENRFYIDAAAQWAIDRVVLVFAGFIREIDRRVVNDAGVDGPAARTVDAGQLLRGIQTGYVFNYALIFTIAAVIIVAVAVLAESL